MSLTESGKYWLARQREDRAESVRPRRLVEKFVAGLERRREILPGSGPAIVAFATAGRPRCASSTGSA
jgi:hypothetical protein